MVLGSFVHFSECPVLRPTVAVGFVREVSGASLVDWVRFVDFGVGAEAGPMPGWF
jgi:hypothetical protein